MQRDVSEAQYQHGCTGNMLISIYCVKLELPFNLVTSFPYSSYHVSKSKHLLSRLETVIHNYTRNKSDISYI